MTDLYRISSAVALAALICGTAVTEVRAQTPALRLTCMSSARLLCPKEVAAMDRKAAQACLAKNLAKATPACRDAAQAYKAQHPGAAPN
jgi:hypothetical protein